MVKRNPLSESLEDYLEVILELERTEKVARAKNIAEKLGVQRGSVTGALKSLEKKKLINYEPYSFITLTKEGAKIAKAITRRHEALKDFFLKVLQVDSKTAEETACKMEHAVDDATYEKLVSFVEYLFQCPRTGPDWIQSFIDFYNSNEKNQEKCKQCLNDCKVRFEKNDK